MAITRDDFHIFESLGFNMKGDRATYHDAIVVFDMNTVGGDDRKIRYFKAIFSLFGKNQELEMHIDTRTCQVWISDCDHLNYEIKDIDFNDYDPDMLRRLGVRLAKPWVINGKNVTIMIDGAYDISEPFPLDWYDDYLEEVKPQIEEAKKKLYY